MEKYILVQTVILVHDVLILPNVFIGNAITVGAATCVSKSLKNKGAYVSPPVIHLDYSFDEAVLKLKGREMMSRIYKKQIT